MLKIIDNYSQIKKSLLLGNFYFRFYLWIKKRYPMLTENDIKYIWKIIKSKEEIEKSKEEIEKKIFFTY